MDLSRLIQALSDPVAYLHPVDSVEVRQTHISVVFLAGPYAYKIKKPLCLGFLDYGTLEKRHDFCKQEVLLNRRLAATVYLGVVPITRDGTTIRMDGPGEPIEWAVKMRRLPDDSTLGERLRRDEIGIEQVEALAARVAGFHAQAEAGPRISIAGRFETVARNARENFQESAAHVETTMSRTVFERLRSLTDDALARHRRCIEARAARGVPRDIHGDLRLGHVYVFPDQEPPDDLIIIDCIEFDDRFRHADPVADMAFLTMDFALHGRRDLALIFAEAYFQASGDVEGRALLPFYTAYRAAVRGKVEGLKQTETEIPAADRVAALHKARAGWLLALGELETPSRKPCLVLMGGLPGTGKSTLARALAEHAGFTVIRSDVVRKELAGLAFGERTSAEYGRDFYSAEWNERTYSECSRRAEASLFDGKRVLVDASFGKQSFRHRFLELAVSWGVPAVFLVCQAEPDVIQKRLRDRQLDASDADWSVYQEAAARWEPMEAATRRSAREIAAGGDRDQAIIQAVGTLRDIGLQG